MAHSTLSLFVGSLISACTSTYYVHPADLTRAQRQSVIVPAIDSSGRRTTLETRRIRQVRRRTSSGLLEVVVEDSNGQGEFLAASLLTRGVFYGIGSSSFPTTGPMALNHTMLAVGGAYFVLGLAAIATTLPEPASRPRPAFEAPRGPVTH